MNNLRNLWMGLLFLALCIFSLLTGCNQESREPTRLIEATPTRPPATQPTIYTSTPTYAESTKVIPTPRTFQNVSDCGDIDENGHIFYLQQKNTYSDIVPYASDFDLYVMNGNGCYAQRVMEFVSGSPAWSKDWNQLAIGCENNTSLCILDVEQVLRNCFYSTQSNNVCDADRFTTNKYALPQKMSDKNYLNNISWSSDGTRIVIEAEEFGEYNWYNAYILDLAQGGKWVPLFGHYGAFNFDWSPVDADRIAFSGVCVSQIPIAIYNENIDLEQVPAFSYQTNVETRLTEAGISPVWSPDGKTIAFVRFSEDKHREWAGIGKIDVTTNELSWFYEPVEWDKLPWPSHVIVLDPDSNQHRELSWSPDGRYIAFNSSYQYVDDIQIFRYDTFSKEIFVLTADHEPKEVDFFAPAWGP